MRRSFILPAIVGLILMLSFQNCSQGNFESSSTDKTEAPIRKVISDDQIQHFLSRDRIEICPAIMCAAPPEGCRYEQDETTLIGKERRCISSCGRLVCDKRPPIGILPPIEPIVCPMIACSEVPAGCARVAAETTVKDTNGCDLNCGEIKCEDASTQPVDPGDEVTSNTDDGIQEVPIGPKPPIGGILPKPIICPMVMCAAPPEGCFYRPTTRLVGSNDCPGCGELICKKERFETFPIDPVTAD